MNIFLIFFKFIPLVAIISTILIGLSYSVKDRKKGEILFATGGAILFVFLYIAMGLILPYEILTANFENYTGITLMLIIIFAVWMIVSLVINLKNRILLFKNNEKDIYIRDVDVKYSPAVLSYLINNKVETKKDLPATLLNLCAKNILKIEKDENGTVNIIDLKNAKEAQKLTEDEKYAYKMLVEGVTNSKIIIWKNKVEEEYSKYKFSKEHKIPLGKYIFGLYVAIFIVLFAYCMITGEFVISGTLATVVMYLIITTFLGAWEMIWFKTAKIAINELLKRNDNNTEFRDTYTRKGALEYNRWKKFERFIEDFTLIKDREYESIVILGKYLSYSIALGINKKCDRELFNKIDKEFSFDYNNFIDMFEKYNLKGDILYE